MKLSKTLKKVMIGTAGACLALSLFSLPLTLTNSNSYAASEDLSFNNSLNVLSVTAYNSNNEIITSTSGSVNIGENTYNLSIQKWEDLAYFKIHAEPVIGEASAYEYRYGVVYTQSEIVDGSLDLKTDHVYVKNICGTSVATLAEIPDIYFYIAGSSTLEDQTSVYRANEIFGTDELSYTDINDKNKIEILGNWGFYQFNFNCTAGATSYISSSNLLEVKPTDANEIVAPLTFAYKTVSSKYSIDNAYYCKIICTKENESDSWRYAFVDRSKLIWNVSGQASNGHNYTLLEKDIREGDKSTSSIYKTYDNSGFDFLLDWNIAGTWDINCKVESTNKVSESQTLKNVKVFNSNIVIIIVVVCVAIAAGVLTFILVRNKKKEKIW